MEMYSIENEIVEYVKSVDPDKGAHTEPSHLGLHCSSSNIS